MKHIQLIFLFISFMTANSLWSLEKELGTFAANLEKLANLLTANAPKKLAGPVPFKNFGITCYMNSILQLFMSIEPINNILLTDATNYYKPGSLGYLYVNLLQAITRLPEISDAKYENAIKVLWANELTAFAKKVQASKEEGGMGDNQCDADEFLKKYLNSLIGDDARYNISKLAPKDVLKHPIGKLLVMQAEQTITCPSINYISSRQKSPFSSLILDIKKEDQLFESLEECLNEYTIHEKLSDFSPEGYPKANNDCVKFTTFTELPSIIIIMLKRFEQDIETEEILKLGHPVAIPETIDFKKYIASLDPHNEYTYDLIGAAQHSGVTEGGHYVAHVRKNDTWYDCNDETITPTTFDASKGNINLSYIFVFQKRK